MKKTKGRSAAAPVSDVHYGDPALTSSNSRLSLNWDKVTCKQCLKHKPKEKSK